MTNRADDAGRSGPDPTYRPCVGIALFNAEGSVFLGRRRRRGEADVGHAWQMPQGGIEPGEDAYAAALRELYEETNVAPASVTRLGETRDWLAYDLPPEAMKASWRGRYRGQRQKWFALGFTGQDREIDVERPGGGAHKPEFDAWRWGRLDEAPALIVPFKRTVYEGVVAAFADLRAWRAPH